MLALAFRLKPSNVFQLFPLRSETEPEVVDEALIQEDLKITPDGTGNDMRKMGS
jgi:hypothetical protein